MGLAMPFFPPSCSCLSLRSSWSTHGGTCTRRSAALQGATKKSHPQVAINNLILLELHAKTKSDTFSSGVVFVVEIHVADGRISLRIEIIVGADTIGNP